MATDNDIVLIYLKDKPLSFARIENILPDSKPNWFHVKLLMLQLPLQVVTWILRDEYINGETFSMDGKQMRLEKVVCPEDLEDPETDTAPEPEQETPAGHVKVISFSDHQKNAS